MISGISGVAPGASLLNARIFCQLARSRTSWILSALHGHGTHIAGIAAGERNVITGVSGVAPGASLLNARIFCQLARSRTSWILSALEWSIENGAHVINMSFGAWQGDGIGRDLFATAVRNAVAAGHIVVAAAGNDGPGEATIGSPAIICEVIAVGVSDIHDGIAHFSSRGPTGEGRVGIDRACRRISLEMNR